MGSNPPKLCNVASVVLLYNWLRIAGLWTGGVICILYWLLGQKCSRRESWWWGDSQAESRWDMMWRNGGDDEWDGMGRRQEEGQEANEKRKAFPLFHCDWNSEILLISVCLWDLHFVTKLYIYYWGLVGALWQSVEAFKHSRIALSMYCRTMGLCDYLPPPNICASNRFMNPLLFSWLFLRASCASLFTWFDSLAL